MGLVLYGDAALESPYVMSIFVALTEKGQPFALSLLELASGVQRRAAFAGPSLTARVPALEHDGFLVSESLAIAEYLERKLRPGR